uniref:HDC02676 n=1 Tax=Drosophila melanogaster TaxID=7227 RepID=Q6IHE8_DROME|nr:TPA_inf: HDC02676 [Drosophila melanogaster]
MEIEVPPTDNLTARLRNGFPGSDGTSSPDEMALGWNEWRGGNPLVVQPATCHVIPITNNSYSRDHPLVVQRSHDEIQPEPVFRRAWGDDVDADLILTTPSSRNRSPPPPPPPQQCLSHRLCKCKLFGHGNIRIR